MHNNWILNPFLYVLMQHNEDYVVNATLILDHSDTEKVYH